MFKAIAVGGIMASLAIYWLCGAFIAMAMYIFPFSVQSEPVVLQNASDVQLVGSVGQATPSHLQDSINVMEDK